MILLALGCAVTAGWLSLRPPRALPGRRPRRRAPSWLRPRAGALPARLRIGLGACLGLVAYLLAGGIAGIASAAIVATATVVVLGRLEPASAQRARERRIQELPHALDLLAGCLASGLPLRRGVREVAGVLSGPVADDLASVVGLVDVGAGEREAWLALTARPGWAMAARDIARAAESGTGLRPTLARHAERARRNAQARRQERARTLGVRSVWPLMTCFLPAFVLIGIVPTVGSMVVRLLGLGP